MVKGEGGTERLFHLQGGEDCVFTIYDWFRDGFGFPDDSTGVWFISQWGLNQTVGQGLIERPAKLKSVS